MDARTCCRIFIELNVDRVLLMVTKQQLLRLPSCNGLSDDWSNSPVQAGALRSIYIMELRWWPI